MVNGVGNLLKDPEAGDCRRRLHFTSREGNSCTWVQRIPFVIQQLLNFLLYRTKVAVFNNINHINVITVSYTDISTLPIVPGSFILFVSFYVCNSIKLFDIAMLFRHMDRQSILPLTAKIANFTRKHFQFIGGVFWCILSIINSSSFFVFVYKACFFNRNRCFFSFCRIFLCN